MLAYQGGPADASELSRAQGRIVGDGFVTPVVAPCKQHGAQFTFQIEGAGPPGLSPTSLTDMRAGVCGREGFRAVRAEVYAGCRPRLRKIANRSFTSDSWV